MVDVSHVYVHAWALGCFHSLISTQTFQRALTASVDRFSGVTKSGRVWRKVSESNAGSVPSHRVSLVHARHGLGTAVHCIANSMLVAIYKDTINFLFNCPVLTGF